MALTTAVADAFLAARLTGDATLDGLLPGGIWRDRPPQGAAYPFGVWQFQSGTVLRGAGPARLWSDLIYVVKVVAKGPSIAGAPRDAADRIDALLDLARGSASGGTVVACVLEGELAYSEVAAGVVYQHLGGRYRLYAQGA
jgi:hypothetical protein